MNRLNNRSNANARYGLDNSNSRLVEIAQHNAELQYMKTTSNLYKDIYSNDNLYRAYKNSRKRKTKKNYIKVFEKNLGTELKRLQYELETFTYKPKRLQTFIVRDPKTRKISKSNFRDRVVHHALINIIEPIFDKSFIHDSYANRKGKGSLGAIKRFDYFKSKVSKNNKRICYILKADIKHYFKEVDHKILIKRKIKDEKAIWLIKLILSNYEGGGANEVCH